MPTVSPSLNTSVADNPRVIWEALATGDTINPFVMSQQYGLAASIQISGTFGGATVKVQISNDNVSYYDMEDVTGTPVSTTSGGLYEVSTAAVYIKPVVTSGSANDIDVIIAFRGSSTSD